MTYQFNAPSFTIFNEDTNNPVTTNNEEAGNENDVEESNPEVLVENDHEMDSSDAHDESKSNNEEAGNENDVEESNPEVLVENNHEMDSSDAHDESKSNNDLIEKRAISNTPVKRFVMEVSPSNRQSPRLIAIAKEIRRKHADRGLMPPPVKGVRRRSLSEGNNPILTRVEKKHAIRKYEKPLGALTKVDEENLSEMTTYHKKSESQISNNSTALKKGSYHFMKETISQKAMKRIPTKKKEHVMSKDVKGPTKVQPFNFTSTDKSKEAPFQPFISLAELNMKYFTKTPQRYRTRKHNEVERIGSRKTNSKLTIPNTPKLTAKSRTRTVHYATREEIEENEFEEAQKHKFKANPLNLKALQSPKLPIASKKYLTVPTPFDIIDEKKKTNKINESAICNNLMESAGSLASLPHGGLHVMEKKAPTTVKPFSFEARNTESNRRKQERIQKELHDRRKLKEFHAQPMPYFESKDQGVPVAKPLPTTKVQPFHMQSEVFRQTRLHKFQEQVKELENEDKLLRAFQATESISTQREPFIPELPRRTLEDISAFELNTAKRAEERESFNIRLKQKEDQLMAQKRDREDREQKDAEEEVRQLRLDAVHHAQPVRHYNPVDIKLGLLPLTCPESPKLLTKRLGE